MRQRKKLVGEAKVADAARIKRRYHERKAAGLCYRCGKVESPGMCEACRATNRAYCRKGEA